MERRKYFRHPVHMPVKVHFKTDAIYAEAIDVSFGGLSFASPRSLPEGQPVRIQVPTKNRIFEVEATIAYSSEYEGQYRNGLSFTNTSEELKETLREEFFEIHEFHREMMNTFGNDISEEQAAQKWLHEHPALYHALG